MKKVSSSKTNPSKNNVLPLSDDTMSAYLSKISSFKLLNAKEECALAKAAQEGDQSAKKQLVQANLKLVVSLASKTIHVSGIPMVDLISEGNIGLMVSVEKFNYKLGYRFSTYAAWWIKQAMFKAISEQSYAMKIPVYIQETLSKFSRVKREMEQKYNCSIKTCEVAKELDVNPQKIDTYLGAFNHALSLEGTYELSSGREMSLAEVIEDEKQNVWLSLEENSLKNDLKSVLSGLKEREAEVLTYRFGLNEAAKKTLEEIGSLYGVTKECIRQTESRALSKIRNSGAAKELLGCYIL